ncbi:MAG: ANTAR domain-containing protein [Sulfuriferula sp.]|nr:ANTAR domain-containing protein [Sulfuriferula sp.]
MIVDDDAVRAKQLEQAFRSQHYKVAELVESAFKLPEAIARCAPDVIIIGADSPDRDTLEHLCIATRDCPRPVVMFTGDKNSESIRAALKAGVSAYIVDGLDAERIRPILEVARIRFEEHQALIDAANKASRSQQEREIIAEAKHRLMADQSLSEEAAYHAMRRTAMADNRRLVEVAESILQALPPVA